MLLEKEPAMISATCYQIQSAFQQAGKTEELFTLLDQMDFRKFGQSDYLFNMISNMSNDAAFKSRARQFTSRRRGKRFRMSDRCFCK